ncbi:pyridoxamine 5'-phosphate oxidase [Marinoscillum sp. MHG1-6]|uniref:pyridoxamine 5'-phosphate oxidase n=1 Tax=Marinoscillum sp. MHG1-6 TaxID=2959627 RepID=UPI002157A38E|nr:pyridoxamine 5'-phosphate oxidase [Marinoscillum sp. MHG1-6]
MKVDIAGLRNEYSKAELDVSTVDESPFKQFEKWFEEALNAELLEPNAMILGTSDGAGLITQRTVLLKAFDTNGFVFYTNYNSRKAKQIEQNNRVSLLFPWYGLERQVSITGSTERVSSAESLKYFLSRPAGSQMGAWVSHQSSVITSRSILESKLEQIKQKFKNGKIPLPDFWGGYRVIPDSIEFWQGRPSRLHDRILYSHVNNEWKIERLSP